jgi:hypothetical protein
MNAIEKAAVALVAATAAVLVLGVGTAKACETDCYSNSQGTTCVPTNC